MGGATSRRIVAIAVVPLCLISAIVAVASTRAETAAGARLVVADVAGLAVAWGIAVAAALAAHRGCRSRLFPLAVVAAAFAVAAVVRSGFLAGALVPHIGDRAGFLEVLRLTAADTTLLMGLFLVGGRALAVYPALRSAALDHTSREIQVRRARLATLTGQIRPHFTGNALNCVAGLALTDIPAARSTLRRLRSVLLRTSRYSDAQEIRLREELVLVQDYVAIEEARFQDRLKVHFDIQPATLDAYIPSLVLQPLVENAIVHGAIRQQGRSDIHVRAELHEDELHIVVEDCGPGLPRRKLVRRVGSSVTQERLSSVYPGAARLTLGERLEGGARARVFLPFTTTPSLAQTPSEALGETPDDVDARSRLTRSEQMVKEAVFAFWLLVCSMYAAQVQLADGGAWTTSAAKGGIVAAGGCAVTLLAYHLGRTMPLERGQRIHGVLAAGLLLAPPVLLYWRTVLGHIWSTTGVAGMPEAARLIALSVGVLHVLFTGYVVHQQSVIAAQAALLHRRHGELSEVERRQRWVALTDAEVTASIDAIDDMLDRDPEAARRYMVQLMERLRRAAENRV